MRTLTERCRILREDAVELKSHLPYVEGQWVRNFYRGEAEAVLPDGEAPQKLINSYLTARGMERVIRNVCPYIRDGELLVGHNYCLQDYPYGTVEELRQDLEKKGCLSAEEIAACADWYTRARQRHIHAGEVYPWATIPDPDKKEDRYTACGFAGNAANEQQRAAGLEMAAMGYIICANHSVIGYRQVLELGFEGLLHRVDEYAARNGDSLFYESVRIVCRAACTLGDRYAEKAEELLLTEQDERRRAELKTIAETCRRVPRHPARSFREALQSLWFAHIINTWEDGINANSLGRLDQILYPYYKADLDAGVLNEDAAFELVCCLWIKLYRDYDVQQSCVGGCGPDGGSAVNALSWMMLDATEALDFVRCLSVRFDAHTDPAFVQRALEVVGHVQKGIPFFFNDSVMIPALESVGIAHEDALDYTQIGCVETVIPGKSNPHAVTARVNLLKALEYALADGRSMTDPTLQPGLTTGGLAALDSFDALKDAVCAQIRHLLRIAVDVTVRTMPLAEINEPKPYKSLLTEGCIESGLDFNAHGAKYDYYHMMLLGLPNLADSLAALQELVYRKKRYTLPQIVEQLQNDFPDEAIRLDLVNKAPKFGNDNDEVDGIAIEMLDIACDELEKLSAEYGYPFHAQPFTYLWMVDHGLNCAASPDGRHAGEILAYSVSPMQGRDFNGFTALINSLSKLPTRRTPGTTSAIVEADPTLFTDRNLPLFTQILLTGAARGLSNVQFNITDAETLLDAQKHPDKHRNLAVRVSGFSQKFYLLDKRIQDHIICRTKHTEL